MTVRLDYKFLADSWVNRDKCRPFLNFILDRAHYDFYAMNGAISTNSHTFCPPFKCEDGTEWCIFDVEEMAEKYVKEHHGNRYRMIVTAVDDEVFVRYFRDLTEVYQFLELFKDGDLTLKMVQQYLIAE